MGKIHTLLSYDDFIKNEGLIYDTQDKIAISDYKDLVNEAWQSKNIMPLISAADKNSNRAWYKSFIKDFYKTYNISIDLLKDEDFIESKDPSNFFKGELRSAKVSDTAIGNFPHGKKYLAIFLNDDPSLEVQANDDLQSIEKVLKLKYKLEQQVINNIVNTIKNDKINVSKIRPFLKKELKDVEGIDMVEIEKLITEYDAIRRLHSPVITAIILGGHAVFHGFEMISTGGQTARRQLNIPWQQDRYGVLNSPVLINRYFGLSPKTNINKTSIPSNSTKVYYVDVEKLVAEYDMGTKIKDRKFAKIDNPAFMDDSEHKKNFNKRVMAHKRNHVDPASVSKMLDIIMKTYSGAFSKAMLDIESTESEALLNLKAKVGNDAIEGGDKLLAKIAEITKNYKKLYIEYNKFMKSISEADKDKIMNNKSELSGKEIAVSDQIDGYNKQLIDYKFMIKDVFNILVSTGVQFAKKDLKLFA